MVTCGASLVVVVQLKKASQIIQERPKVVMDEGQTAVVSMVQALIGGDGRSCRVKSSSHYIARSCQNHLKTRCVKAKELVDNNRRRKQL